jgi:hypothetical protein
MTAFASKPIPIDEKPRIFFKFNGPEQELEFVAWTTKFLIVKYPPGSAEAGKPWRMGRNLVNHWIKAGVLRIEGDVPPLALTE